jgi:hypothetical protein
MRRKTAASTKKGRVKRTHAAKRTVEASVDDLLESAEAAMTSLDVEKAISSYSKAASLLRMGRTSSFETRERGLIQILENLGESKVSVGDQDGAKQDFREALQLLEQQDDTDTMPYHETRSSLYFYVGQLCMEQEALQAYQQGVTSLESCIQLAQEASTDKMEEDENTRRKVLPELHQRLSGAYCTIAELYLTDLCYESDAEDECERYLEKALQIKDVDGEPVVDALQTMASLRLSQQQRRSEAVPYIIRAYEKMRVGSEALASLVGLTDQGGATDNPEEQALELKEVDEANNLPEFEFRCQTAKLLLECAALLKETRQESESVSQQEEQCVLAAIAVLGSLLAQNDEVVEIWFLTGCAFAARNPTMVDSAQYYLQRTMEMLVDIKKALQQEVEYAEEAEKLGIEDDLKENQNQIEDVQAKLDDLDESDATSSMDE